MVMKMTAWTTSKTNEAVTTTDKEKGSFALGREAYLAKRKAAQDRNKNFLCVGIWGEAKSAKSGVAADILTEEDIANDMHVFVWDYDNRFIDVKRNHYANIENLVVFNPIERHPDSLVDIEATKHNAQMHYEEAMSYLKDGKLKAVIVDGADKFLTDVCETYMRVKHNLENKQAAGRICSEFSSLHYMLESRTCQTTFNWTLIRYAIAFRYDGEHI